MFIKLAYNYLYDSWRYLAGLLVIFLIWQIGSIPFLIAAIVKFMSGGGSLSELQENQTLLMTVLDSNLTLFLMLLSFAIGLVGIWFWAKYVHKQPMKALTTTRKKIDWNRFWLGFGLIVITIVVTTYLDYKSHPENYVWQFEVVPFITLAIIAILLIPLQTSFEEYFFRGYLMQGIGVMAKNKWVPLIVTSVIFGGLHFFNPEVDKLGPIIMIFYIGTGFFLGVITLMDEGMELALGFHAGNNLIAALLVTTDWTVFQTNSILKDISEPSAGFDILLPVLIIYPIFIGIMAWKYKWTGWREKLFGKVAPPHNEQTI